MNTTKLATIGIVAATGLFAVLALPSGGLAENKEPMSIEALAAESATTAAQHQALAAYYRGKAADARAVAKTHREMAASYVTKADPSSMRAHCEGLVRAAEQEATEYDAMAAIQDAEAKKAAK